MKKLITMMLTLAMVFSLAACGNSDNSGDSNGDTADSQAESQESQEEDSSDASDADSDLAYVKDKGTLVVGITEYM